MIASIFFIAIIFGRLYPDRLYQELCQSAVSADATTSCRVRPDYRKIARGLANLLGEVGAGHFDQPRLSPGCGYPYSATAGISSPSPKL
jgi:hypothetical protein